MAEEQDQKTIIKGYARQLNSAIPQTEDATLDFVVDEVIDRVMIYLNATAVNPILNRVIARIVVGVYNKAKAEATNTGATEREVKSISDNGQSVTFGDGAKNYLANAEDESLFAGFTAILNRYREADCGNTGILQKQNS